MRLARLILALVLVAAVVASGCTVSSSTDDLPTAKFESIDEVRGTYGGVGVGDAEEDVWGIFERKAPVGHDESFKPTGVGEDDFFAPNYIPAETAYAYEDVIFWFPVEDIHLGRGSPLRGKQDEVGGFLVAASEVHTLRGIQVGDTLDEAKAVYPELECSERPAGEVATFPACTGRVAEERHIWFGGDPIATIGVSRSPM